MKELLNYAKASPDAVKALRAVEAYVRGCGLDHMLLELVKTRASQINGCAHCLDMHTKDARVAGESEQRLYVLSAWRETPFFSERERAALNWTEHVTLIAQDHVPDAVYEDVRRQFSEAEVANLTLVIAAINVSNRFSVSFRQEPGHYTPSQHG